MSSSLVLSGVGLTDPTANSFLSAAKILAKGDEITGRKRNGFCFHEDEEEAAESSETSSIGADSSSAASSDIANNKDGGEEEEVQSTRMDGGALISLDSIEESLPIKRGLSNFIPGKSKSFASLSDMATAAATDLAKAENPFNKRRRILMASKMRRASYSSLVSTYLPPLLSPDNAVLEEGDEEEDEKAIEISVPDPVSVKNELMKKKAFRSPRSFSLSDLSHA